MNTLINLEKGSFAEAIKELMRLECAAIAMHGGEQNFGVNIEMTIRTGDVKPWDVVTSKNNLMTTLESDRKYFEEALGKPK